MENALSMVFFLVMLASIVFLVTLYQTSFLTSSRSASEKLILNGERSLENLLVQLKGSSLQVSNNGVKPVKLRYIYAFSDKPYPEEFSEVDIKLKPGESARIELSALFPNLKDIGRTDVVTELGNVFSSKKQNRLMRGVGT